jgi:hypothetical protein
MQAGAAEASAAPSSTRFSGRSTTSCIACEVATRQQSLLTFESTILVEMAA